MAHAPLLTRDEAPEYGINADFLAQFEVRAIEVGVAALGALGVATFRWRRLGETNWSPTVKSSPRAPWKWQPAGSFATLVFAAATYATTATYTIDEDGTVVRSGAGPDAITATRWDAFDKAAETVTEKALDLLQDLVVLPLVSWGAGIKGAAADWIKYELKSGVGMAPGPAATGDENIRLRYEDAVHYFTRLGRGDKKPPDLIDSSREAFGGLKVRSAFDDDRGW